MCVCQLAVYVSDNVCVCQLAVYVCDNVCVCQLAVYVCDNVCVCVSWLCMCVTMCVCVSWLCIIINRQRVARMGVTTVTVAHLENTMQQVFTNWHQKTRHLIFNDDNVRRETSATWHQKAGNLYLITSMCVRVFRQQLTVWRWKWVISRCPTRTALCPRQRRRVVTRWSPVVRWTSARSTTSRCCATSSVYLLISAAVNYSTTCRRDSGDILGTHSMGLLVGWIMEQKLAMFSFNLFIFDLVVSRLSCQLQM